MTRVLAIDTSTWWGSVALIEHDGAAARIVAETGARVDDSHAEHLLDWIARLLGDSGWSKNGVDAYVATRGPGSFTGIRVALGTVRGLALATDRPCVGVTTLEAIAEAHGPSDTERLPVMEAGRGELYAAVFDSACSPPALAREPWVGPAPDVVATAAERGAVLILGPGTEIAADLSTRLVARAPARLAGAAGRVAAMRIVAGSVDESLAPLYIRPPDAVLKRRS